MEDGQEIFPQHLVTEPVNCQKKKQITIGYTDVYTGDIKEVLLNLLLLKDIS